MTQFGVHAGFGYDELAPAIGHDGAHVEHVGAVADRRILALGNGQRLLNWLGLAGESGLLDLQAHVLQQAAVGGHEVAGLQDDDVAGHKIDRGDFLDLAVAADADGGNGQLLERGHGLLCPVFLAEAQGGVQEDDGHDHNCVGELAE